MSIELLVTRAKVLKRRTAPRQSFKQTRQGWEVAEAITVNRNTDGFEWNFNGRYMMHERVYFPFNVFKEISTLYWCQRTYTDKALAEIHAKQYGGEVREEFYCDPENPAWFVEFDDFDKAAKYCEELLTLV